MRPRWTQEHLAELLDVHPLTVTRWESDPSASNALTPGRATLLAIAFLSGASSEWLTSGVGEPFPTSARHGGGGGSGVYRPTISGTASCGPGGEIQDPGPYAEQHPLGASIVKRLLKEAGGGEERDLYWLRVCGDSMLPTLREDELVLLHAGLAGRMHPRNHGVYLVRRSPDSVEARVKRLRLDLAPGQLTLTSDNPAFKDLVIDPDGIPLQQLLLGRVILLQRHLTDLDPQESDW